MKITDADSSRLARFLSKGIFGKPGNKDVNITIGENAQIGIERRGHKYYLYIRYNDVVNKADILTGFNENVAMSVLAANIKSLIERSVTIRDVVLNMEKVPLLPEEAMASSTKESESVDATTFPVQTSAAPAGDAMLSSGTIQDDMPGTSTQTPMQTNGTMMDDMMSGRSTEPVNVGTPMTMMTNGTMMENTPKTSAAPVETAAQNFIEEEVAADEDDSFYEEIGGQPVLPDDSDPHFNEDNELEEMEMDAMTTEMENTRIEHSIGIKGKMPARVDNKKIIDESYLASVVGSDAELKQKMIKAVEQLVARDKGSAIEFYSRILYRLLPSFNNDVSSAATGTGLDERDFMLAVYEKPAFGK